MTPSEQDKCQPIKYVLFDFAKRTGSFGPIGRSTGAKAIVDVLTKSGVAERREIPVRLALGSDPSEPHRYGGLIDRVE